MAVHRQTYQRYGGALTPAWTRWLVPYQFARRAVFRSKAVLGFYVLCFLPPLLFAIGIYIAHNSALKALLPGVGLLSIDAAYFESLLHFQGSLAFLFTALAAPGLIAPDLTNGGLTLYLSRPLSRAQYLLGKLLVLVVLLAQLVLAPLLLLWALAAVMADAAWRGGNAWMLGAIVIGGLAWILILSLLALALSAWLRWRIAAGGALLAVYFFGGGFAAAINGALRTQGGYRLDLMQLMSYAWLDLFRQPGVPPFALTQVWTILIGVALVSLGVTLRRLRAVEVVK